VVVVQLSANPSAVSISTTAMVGSVPAAPTAARGLGTARATVDWFALETAVVELSPAAANSSDLRLRVIMPVAAGGALVVAAGVKLTERAGRVANDVGRITVAVDAAAGTAVDETVVALVAIAVVVIEAVVAAMLGDAIAMLLAADGDEADDVEADAAPNGVTLANKDEGEGVVKVDTNDDTNGRRVKGADGSGALSVSAAGVAIDACKRMHKPLSQLQPNGSMPTHQKGNEKTTWHIFVLTKDASSAQ
jgi:hypothetical protein